MAGRRPKWLQDALIWLVPLPIGVAAAYAVILFIGAISWTHNFWLGTSIEALMNAASAAAWWQVAAGPIIAGILCAGFMRFLPPEKRPLGIAEVMEAGQTSHWHHNYMSLRAGLMSALYSAVSLGGGASAGREGPAVHLSATIAAVIARAFRLPPHSGRLMLACGAGAAVAASFNAPIAGMLFAHEVVLRHYRLVFMVPTAIAAASATAIARIHLGDYPAFIIPPYAIHTYIELPLFALLGAACAGVAIVFVYALRIAQAQAGNFALPLWTRPMLAGCVVGAMGVMLPAILGVGYGATDIALKGQWPIVMLAMLIPAKIIATAISLAGRFGGGTFSPALFLGAMTGSLFGILAGLLAPAMTSSSGLYAIAGMGGVAAAVLGAPMSTLLISFELLGDYRTTLALMLTVSIATALTHMVLGSGYLRWQMNTLHHRQTGDKMRDTAMMP